MNNRFRAVLLCAAALLLIAVVIATAVNNEQNVSTPEPEPQPGSAQLTPEVPAESKQDDVAQNSGVSLDGLSSRSMGWGPGTEVNELNQPTGAITAQAQYGDLGGRFVFDDTEEKVIYLTFDLGYENGYTEKIIDEMNARNVQGIFFITRDYYDEAPDVIQKLIDTGHVLGNHTWTHPSLPTLSDEQFEQELMKLHNLIEEEYGYTMTLMRPPRGEYSERSLALATQLGYESWLWSFAYVDWKTDAQPGTSASLQKLIDRAHPGAVYLLHAVSSTNAAIIGDFIDEMHAQGYTFAIYGQDDYEPQFDSIY